MITIISFETWPTKGGIARLVQTISNELSYQKKIHTILTTKGSSAVSTKYCRYVKLLPQKWFKLTTPLYLIRSIIYIFGVRKSSFLTCDLGGIYITFLASYFIKINNSLILHGTEILVLKKKFKSNIIRRFQRYFDNLNNIIFISNTVKITFLQNFNLKNNHDIIYNSHTFKNNINDFNKINNQFVIVARNDYRKRIDLVLKSVPLINRNISLKIIGDGPTNKILKDLSNKFKNNLVDVEFCGFVSDAVMRKILLESSVLMVLPGRFNNSIEGFGLTILEALDYYCFPLCLNVDGPSEVCSLLEINTVENNVNGISNFINNFSYYETLSVINKSRDKAQIIFSQNKQVNKILSIIS